MVGKKEKVLKRDMKVTPEQLGQFWNHSIHPITGFRITKGEPAGAKENLLFERRQKEKFNKE